MLSRRDAKAESPWSERAVNPGTATSPAVIAAAANGYDAEEASGSIS